ncbi:MAG: DNA/RNA non-specific endonuclease [Saprospiraceae bacterium]|nr:DNA/RNA non-specific endonuclease [Saprospiraceae bacterium]
MTNKLSVVLFLCLASIIHGQSLEKDLDNLQSHLEDLDVERVQGEGEIEEVKFQMIRRDLLAVGLPSAEFITHNAMMLEYDEQHEQAKWVAHIILPDIITGTVMRTNDFRADTLVATGSTVDDDYYQKEIKRDGSIEFLGHGYDRAHLAPSADFRWSARALSETFYYSNMTPQLGELNRGGWADLEMYVRAYVINHPGTQLYVVTGPVLKDDLKVLENSLNQVTIPEHYYKVLLDLERKKGIGFLMPNQAVAFSAGYHVRSIDAIEALTGLDFFNKIEDEADIEKEVDPTHWLGSLEELGYEPMSPVLLPPGHINTVQAKLYAGNKKKIIVCGKVVSSSYTKSGNLWFNLDKRFPNHIFSFFIKKEDLVHFAGDPQAYYMNKVIGVKGQVMDLSDVPTIQIQKEGDLKIMKAE